MPDLIARLVHDLDRMRSGHGARLQELRLQLSRVDAGLRRLRNVERLRLANTRAKIRMLDTRADPAPLQAEAEASTKRLEALDLRIAEAIARQLRPRSP
jgi:hypothetical protein